MPNEPVAPGPYKLPVKPLHNPLTPDDELMLNTIATHHPIADDFLKRCHNCGLDMAALLGQLEAQKAFVKTVKDHFFPDQLPTESL